MRNEEIGNLSITYLKPISMVAMLLLLLTVVSTCQTLEDGWKGIKPLRTTRSEVEKLLGPPVSDEKGFYNHRTPDAFIHLEYTGSPCTDLERGRGRYTVPQNTVLTYMVTPKKELTLTELRFTKARYERDTGDGHLVDYAAYINRSGGVTIEVELKNGVEYVSTIHIKPNIWADGAYRCKPRAKTKTSN